MPSYQATSTEQVEYEMGCLSTCYHKVACHLAQCHCPLGAPSPDVACNLSNYSQLRTVFSSSFFSLLFPDSSTRYCNSANSAIVTAPQNGKTDSIVFHEAAARGPLCRRPQGPHVCGRTCKPAQLSRPAASTHYLLPRMLRPGAGDQPQKATKMDSGANQQYRCV